MNREGEKGKSVSGKAGGMYGTKTGLASLCSISGATAPKACRYVVDNLQVRAGINL